MKNGAGVSSVSEIERANEPYAPQAHRRALENERYEWYNPNVDVPWNVSWHHIITYETIIVRDIF